jgi:hypothetical protein
MASLPSSTLPIPAAITIDPSPQQRYTRGVNIAVVQLHESGNRSVLITTFVVGIRAITDLLSQAQRIHSYYYLSTTV